MQRDRLECAGGEEGGRNQSSSSSSGGSNESQNNLGGPVGGMVTRGTEEDAQVSGLFILWVVQSLH